jgi:ABC-2 type transport system ATP-binding protein
MIAGADGATVMNRMEKFWGDGTEIPVRSPTVADGGWDVPRHDPHDARSDHRSSDQDAAEPVRSSFTTTEPVSPVRPRCAPAIVLENLTKKYGSHFAVDDVSFFVPKGATLGLLGGNGAGKTTTIAMIMGLVIPTCGSARVLGHDMAYARHKVLGRMNFQSPYVAMPGQLTVRQNLEVFARLYNVREVRARIAEVVEEFGLGDLLGRETARLSAGQKTRVALAKALLNNPEVLLLDEPTASLDPDRAEWIRGLLRAYQARRGTTILLSSHNMQEVEQLCDYVVIMRHGRVVAIGTPAEITRAYGCRGLEGAFMRASRGAEPSQEAGEHQFDQSPAPSADSIRTAFGYRPQEASHGHGQE